MSRPSHPDSSGSPTHMARTGITTNFGKPKNGWRRRLYIIIFEADTPAGRWFDFTLIGAILISVLAVVLDSVADIRARYGSILMAVEWFFTVLFTVEYIARLICVNHPLRYARSFYGIIDLLTTSRKIFIFLSVAYIIVFINATIMYVVEGAENGFTSIPTSAYWAITTVGFGEIVPQTDLGRAIASAMMLIGWGILVVLAARLARQYIYCINPLWRCVYIPWPSMTAIGPLRSLRKNI